MTLQKSPMRGAWPVTLEKDPDTTDDARFRGSSIADARQPEYRQRNSDNVENAGRSVQYRRRAMPENSVLRADSPEFIRQDRRSFCRDDAWLAEFGLWIMNPPL